MELTQPQKGVICDIAREAFDAWPEREAYEREHVGVNAFTAWRHAEQEKAVGRRSLRHCNDADYHTLQIHFIRLRANHQAARQNLSFNFNP